MRRFAAVSWIAIPLAGVLVLSGCSSAKTDNSDELQIVSNPVAAKPAVSPAVTVPPAGQVLATGAVSALAVAEGTLVVALAQPPSLQLYDLNALASPPVNMPLYGKAEKLTVAPGRVEIAEPAQGVVQQLSLPDRKLTETKTGGQPASSIAYGADRLVAMGPGKDIRVLPATGPARTIGGQLYSADDVVDTGKGVVVLDRLRTAVFSVDVAAGKVNEGLRAGDGAANAVADSYGRVLVTDARAGALIAFSAAPLIMRQRYPVPGGAYGIAYDAQRSLAWVTLTGRNEVVGFDVRGGEPVEKYRFPTVRQPDSVGVDERSGRVLVGSAAGEGTQVIQP
ncbi:YncE family protein [Amycolatopsis kentuckyensis]|uniref:YncE family protein n=1 Tax=Amycolatopsis kentuckyensis TaxID=218823 RepID=UPI00356415BF